MNVRYPMLILGALPVCFIFDLGIPITHSAQDAYQTTACTVLQQLCLSDKKTGRPSVHCTAAAFPLVTTKPAGLVSAELNSLPSLKLKSK